jgi:hypothetical protein
MQFDDFLEKCRLCARHILDCLIRHGFGQEAHEIARMPSLKRHTNLAVGLEAADTRAVPGTGVDDNEGTARLVNVHRLGRDNPHQNVVDWSLKCPPVDDKIYFIVEHMRRSLGQMFAILIAALAHHAPIQHASLRGIDKIFECRRKDAKRRRELTNRILAR